MKLSYLLRRIFITKKCVACKEPISYDTRVPFCKECVEHWNALLELKCHKCGYKHNECTCLPSQVRQIGKHGAAWCVFYEGKSDLSANNLVFVLKREYNKDMIEFCAEQMSRNIMLLCSRYGIDYKEYCITFAPRRKTVKARYGFDQSQKLAFAVAKILGLKAEACLINIGIDEQKSLTKEQRRENAQKSYIANKKAQIANKKYFLVDDIMTSGSTLRACADILFTQGAKDVIAVTYAKDNR